MSTRDAGEQRSLLRVISTILQMTRQEAADVEARISELEKTMVSRRNGKAASCSSRPIFAYSLQKEAIDDLIWYVAC